jgi:Mlc titration factor MtfA (ptsG expression regulator)
VREQPFPAAWRDILLRTFPLYERLPDPDRDRLDGLIQVFLAEKNIEGCGGLELTDEIRVTIAAQACVLLLHLDHANYFADLRSILVYPSTVVPVYAHEHEHGAVAEEVEPVLGQSWSHGTIILAWDSVKRGSAIPNDGRNVTLHEFAHQLDQETGEADGTPYLDTPSAMRAWSAVMGEHYIALRSAVEDGRKTLLDDYGATNPAEFFAVATEFFFEKPLQLQRKHPALYDELAEYYGQDPASWRA